MWGHGARNCTLNVACMFCAGEHSTQECTYVVNGVAEKGYVPKCMNCKGPHSANFEECPSLNEYKKLQETMIIKNSIKNLRRLYTVNFTSECT